MSRYRQTEGQDQATLRLSMDIIGFVLCLENADCEDLELNKVYPVVAAESSDPDDYLRVMDESEEDYLYPKSMFEPVSLPNQIRDRVLENLAA